MAMNLQALKTELLANPLTAPHVPNNLGEALLILRTTPATVHRSRMVTNRALTAEWVDGPDAAEAFLQKLEAIAASGQPGTAVLKRQLKWLDNEDGIDVGNQTTRGQIAALAAANPSNNPAGITSDDRDAFLALSQYAGTRMELILGAPDVEDGAVTALFFNADGSLKE